MEQLALFKIEETAFQGNSTSFKDIKKTLNEFVDQQTFAEDVDQRRSSEEVGDLDAIFGKSSETFEILGKVAAENYHLAANTLVDVQEALEIVEDFSKNKREKVERMLENFVN